MTWIASKRRTSQLTELKRLSIRSCAPMAHSAYSACMNQVQLIGGSITVCARAVVGLPSTRMHKGLSRCLNGDGSGFSTVVTSSVSQARAHQAAFLEWRQAWSRNSARLVFADARLTAPVSVIDITTTSRGDRYDREEKQERFLSYIYIRIPRWERCGSHPQPQHYQVIVHRRWRA